MRGTAWVKGLDARTLELIHIARVGEYERNPAPMSDTQTCFKMEGKQ